MTTNSIIKYLAILLIILPYFSSGQVNTNYQIKIRTEEAKKLMNEGQYKSAYNAFRKILNSGKVLPTNLSYYFSETLCHLGQYQNSQNFINKYLKITGKGGDYYQEANELSKLLTDKFSLIESCKLCDISGYRLIPCTRCNDAKSIVEPCHICSSMGITSCKKCAGEGVLIVTDVFDEKIYQTCDKCLGEGYHTCDTCSGTKSIQLNCPVCLGSGFEKSTTICDHQSHLID